MKKTLLAVAAALAASVISSQAQVYSQNVVGYVNQTFGPNQFQILGSSMLNGSDSSNTNGDINALFGSGLISSPVPATVGNPGQDPNLSTNTQIFVWNGSGFSTYFYFNQADAVAWDGAGSLAGFYDAGGTYQTTTFLTQGLAAFLYNHSPYSITSTIVGTVPQGTNVTTIHAGFNLISLQEPLTVNPTNIVVNGTGNQLPYGLPIGLTSSNDATAYQNTPTTGTQDSIFIWNGTGFATYFYFNQADATSWEGFSAPAGFYDAGGSPMPSSPVVNGGFFLSHIGSTINWTNGFVVQ
jgi:hypothetical protein